VDLQGVTFHGQFVAVGYGGAVLTSPDGAEWTVRDSGVPDQLAFVTHADGEFLAVGEGGLLIASTDGIAWTLRPTPTRDELSAIDGAGAVTVAVGGRLQGLALTSGDAVDWSAPQPQPWSLRGVAFGEGRYVAVGRAGTVL